MTSADAPPDPDSPGSLAEALAALQAQMPAIGKHATGKVSGTSKAGREFDYTYHYAPGEAITPVLYPLMAALGLSFTAAPTMHDGRFVLEYALLHTSGQSRGPYRYPLPDPDRYGPQDLGKAETYARRYALNAVTGLFPGGDDSDANGMTETAAQKTERRIESAGRNSTVAPARATPPDRPGLPRAVSSQEKQRAKTSHTKAGTTRNDRARDEDPWAVRPPEERENEPGTANDLQIRAIWMLAKKQGIEDPDAAHAAARGALGLPPDALLTEPDENGEVRETFKRLSHAQAAEFIRQLQSDGDN